MNFTRSAEISGGAGPLGVRIARLARALVVPVFLSAITVLSGVPQASALEPLIVNQARIIGDEARTRITQVIWSDHPAFTLLKPFVRLAVRAFLRQDGRMVELQNPGLAHDPALLWIDDADRQAKWYQALKRGSRHDLKRERMITMHITLRHKMGVLSSVLSLFANTGANILTINQSIPMSGTAFVTISAETADMSIAAEELITSIQNTPGVKKVEVTAG